MNKLYCAYCNEIIEDKKRDSRKADSKRYHIGCLRKLKKEIKRREGLGTIQPGKENTIKKYS